MKHQRFIYETDDLDAVREILTVVAETIFNRKNSEYVQLHIKTSSPGVLMSDGRRYLENGIWSHPTRLWVCTLADYRSDIKKEDQEFIVPRNMVSQAVGLLEDAKQDRAEEFLGTCPPDDNYDSSEIGFAIRHRPNCGWNNLDLFLTNIYCGK